MEEETQEVLSHVQQLIKSVDPIIKTSQTLENVEDSLQHLEETDENFHKYDFVQYMRNQIENTIGSLIDEEIEKNSSGSLNTSTSGQETLVQMVTKSVEESEKYSDLVHRLEKVTLNACDTLVRSIEDEQASNIGDEDVHSHHSKRFRSVFSEGASTCESSFNQGMFFMSQQQFHKIAEDLNSKQPLDVRREALRHLCQIPPSDVMASESWEHLRVSLMDALSDSDAHIAHDALSFHARMFAVSNNNIMRETYTCLAEHLQSVFTSSKMDKIGNLNEGLDITKPEIVSILKKIRLLNEFQREVPSIWVRYPEWFLEKIVESTLSIVAIKPKAGKGMRHSLLTSLHLMALVDPKAHWFRKWLHGNYSRCVVIKQLEDEKNHRQVLIEAAFRCIEFSTAYLQSEKSAYRTKLESTDKRTIYTKKELQYVVFLHSLSIICQLLLYSGGRSLFPLISEYFESEVTIQQLLTSWIKILHRAKLKPKLGHKSFEPAFMTGKVLRTLFSCNAFVGNCVTQDIIDALMEPLKTWLHKTSSKNQPSNKASEYTLLHISEILSCLSSTPKGRSILMFGCGKDHSNDSNNIRKISAAAHVIAEFAQKSLSGTLPGTGSHRFPTYPVTGSFVFVCRQMYNTCSGLIMLHDYKLHKYIANAWKLVHDHQGEISQGLHPEVQDDKPPSLSSSHNLMLWEENLIDNLLNFAATPKGLLLLVQTGAIKECVAYMFSRYTKKLQVSKCEKFGYGVMVTQVAASALGVKALQMAGFERTVVQELWSGLECSTDDVHMPVSLRSPMAPPDRAIQKSFYALVNILSAFPAVYEILSQQSLQNKPSYSFRESPFTVVDLLDRLVFINSEAKIHSLFNYEQSHMIGLRFLNVLACSLDTLVLLQAQFAMQESLLQMQKDNKTYEGEIIIDALSVERNHILVRSEVVGGNCERSLPPRSIPSSLQHTSSKLLFPWPLFDHYPIPKEYTISSPSKSSLKKENVLSRFLAKTKSTDKNRVWLDDCRTALIKVITSSNNLKIFKSNVVSEILEKTVLALERMPEEKVFSKKQSKGNGNKHVDVSKFAVKLAVRYGKNLNLIKTNTDTANENLAGLLKHTKILKSGYYGHDWFASTIFILMGGNKERAWNFLQKISEILCSGFLWPARLHSSIHLSKEVRETGISVVFSCTGHYAELILQNELPLIHSAFRMSGYTPSQICQHWITQIFWNYLNWTQICQYLSLVIIMGTDYQIYFCLSILKHLKGNILSHRQAHDLQSFLREEPIRDFEIASYINFMMALEKKYRNIVLPDMRSMVEKNK